jgi:hypothetical protein
MWPQPDSTFQVLDRRLRLLDRVLEQLSFFCVGPTSSAVRSPVRHDTLGLVQRMP